MIHMRRYESCNMTPLFKCINEYRRLKCLGQPCDGQVSNPERNRKTPGPLILQKLRKPDSPMQVHKWVPVKFNAGGSPATD